MAARLFTYGRINKYATVPGANHLPGNYYTAYGIQYGAGAVNLSSETTEPGEVVEIVKSTDKGYIVKRATSSLTAATAAIVLRDVMGVNTIQAGVFEEYAAGKIMTVVPASAPQGWSIVVPVVAGQTPAVGGTVYIGLGSGTSVLGAVYAAAQGGGSDTVVLTDWTFATTSFTPTTDASIAAVIQKV